MKLLIFNLLISVIMRICKGIRTYNKSKKVPPIKIAIFIELGAFSKI